MGKPVQITLGVRACELYKADPQPTTQAQLDTYCTLSDDNGGCIVVPPGSTDNNIQNFTSEVYPNQLVKWRVINTVPRSVCTVGIDEISNDADYFTPNPIRGNKLIFGWTSATLLPTLTGTDTYTIKFTVNPPLLQGGDPKHYCLDPKLHGKNTK